MMVSRRQWLAGGAALAATVAGCAPVARGGAPAAKPIGLQLYTVREIFSRDPIGTLEQVAAIGFREVEYGGGGFEAMDHAALRAAMDRFGLVSPSVHIGYDMLASDLDRAVTITKALGADTVILPWLAENRRTAEGWQAVLANLNPLGERLEAAGLGFGYHNHDFEFTVRHGGGSMFDALVAETDPALVKIELDLFWAVAAGEDPKAIIRRLPGRIYSYHVKDRAPDGSMTSVGTGTIDFADIFTLNDIAGVKHFYVENDQAPAPYLPDITTSFAALSRLRA